MSMPQVDDAFIDWMTPITLKKVIQTVDSKGEVTVVEVPVTFQGVIQPLMPTKMTVTPDGNRFWAWFMIHTPVALGKALDDNDVVNYNGKNYKVMLQNDYSLNSYYEYHLVEDYA